MHKSFHSVPLVKVRDGVLSLLLCVVTLSCHKETKAERYAREARETTLQCPMAIDANTTMDSMVYTPSDHRFTYYYKVNGVADSILLANKEMLRQQIHNRLLNAPDMLPYIHDGLSFRYVYHTNDSTSAPVLDFVYESTKNGPHPSLPQGEEHYRNNSKKQ